MRAVLYLLLYGASVQVRPEDAAGADSEAHRVPRVAGIEFAGNHVTRSRVLQRELTLAVGDAADPRQIEASRQAIQNLGLFREVDADTVASAEGVIVIFEVEEKIYLLPFPRLDAKDSGESINLPLSRMNLTLQLKISFVKGTFGFFLL